MGLFVPNLLLAFGGALLAGAFWALALDIIASLHHLLWPLAAGLSLAGIGLIVTGWRLSRPGSSRAEKWQPLGGGFILGSVPVAVAWLFWIGFVREVRQTDEFFREVLAGGDASAAYDAADGRLCVQYTKEQFLAFAEKHPNFLRRDKLGRSQLWRWGK